MSEIKLTQAEKDELLKMSVALSNKIKDLLGECQIWYDSNRVYRGLDLIGVIKRIKPTK